ncbi:hypothetical protein [Phycicoccus ginsengisoli]
MLTSTTTIRGVRLEPGARIPAPSNEETLRFAFVAVCDSVAPERWHGEVMFAGKVVLRTKDHPTYEQAGRAAQLALTDRVLQLLGD